MNFKPIILQEIQIIYKNAFGIGFYWKKANKTLTRSVQLVFRDMGFYLSRDEIIEFSSLVNEAKRMSRCNQCTSPNCCRSLLLKTPSSKIDLALSFKELEAAEDLIKGVLFHLSLREYLEVLSLN